MAYLKVKLPSSDVIVEYSSIPGHVWEDAPLTTTTRRRRVKGRAAGDSFMLSLFGKT
jgi:hypothetical protein